MQTKKQFWGGIGRESFKILYPSIKKLFGETSFLYSENLFEEFIDSFSNYGFCCFPLYSLARITNSGLKQNSCSYFIADRTISSNICINEEQDRWIIGIPEYIERFYYSIDKGCEKAVGWASKEPAGVLVINRKIALDFESNEYYKKRNYHKREMRGVGFLGDSEKKLLDEGRIHDIEYLPKESNIGHFKIEEGNFLVQFYQVILQDFMNKH